MHLLLPLVVATPAPQTLPTDPVDTPLTSRERRQQRPQEARYVDFDDPVDVFASHVGPGVEIVFERDLPAHPPLFSLRADFDDELEQSTDMVKSGLSPGTTTAPAWAREPRCPLLRPGSAGCHRDGLQNRDTLAAVPGPARTKLVLQGRPPGKSLRIR